jgi:hypothetical protein
MHSTAPDLFGALGATDSQSSSWRRLYFENSLNGVGRLTTCVGGAFLIYYLKRPSQATRVRDVVSFIQFLIPFSFLLSTILHRPSPSCFLILSPLRSGSGLNWETFKA